MAPGRSDWLALTLAAGACVLVLASVRRPGAVRWISLLAFLPVPLVALVSRQFDLVGWHGFTHSSPVYQILERGAVPPEEPRFAGGKLRYPWVGHWLIAHISRLTGANVHVLTLGIEVLAQGVHRRRLLARLRHHERGRRDCPLRAVQRVRNFDCSRRVPGRALRALFPQLWLESRVVPLDKFANISAMPVGYAALCISTAAALRVAAGLGSPRHL